VKSGRGEGFWGTTLTLVQADGTVLGQFSERSTRLRQPFGHARSCLRYPRRAMCNTPKLSTEVIHRPPSFT
jgi:hypothetical protein